MTKQDLFLLIWLILAMAYIDYCLIRAAVGIHKITKQRKREKTMKQYSDDIIANAVREHWNKQGFPDDGIAFFKQKYEFEFEHNYEQRAELFTCEASDDYETVIFENDFCEGQPDVTDIHIVNLSDVTDFYIENKLKRSN